MARSDGVDAAANDGTESMKRTGRSIAAIVIALAALWLIWDWIAIHRLKSTIAAIQAHGEPIFPSDFAPKQLDDQQNAATYLKAAAAAISPSAQGPNNSNLSFSAYPPFSPAWYQLADAAVNANGRTFRLMRQARGFDQAAWVPLPQSPIFRNLNNSPLNSNRFLANVIADAATDAHLHGDDAEAIERHARSSARSGYGAAGKLFGSAKAG